MNNLILPQAEAILMVKNRVCARCYGDLSMMGVGFPNFEVSCPDCGDTWGFTHVSRKYAERLGQRALEERIEVKENLADLFPNPHKGKSEQQILEELGF